MIGAIFSFFVDDIIVASTKHNVILEVKSILKSKFRIENLGSIKEYFGLEIPKDADRIYNISQSAYIKEIIENVSFSDAKISKVPISDNYEKNIDEIDILSDTTKYRKLIGQLLYVSVILQPDISASISILAQVISKSTQRH